MYSISIANNKGGVGKTTMSVSLAAELAKKDRVLLVDCDPQGNSTGSLMQNVTAEFSDVLFGKISIEDAIQKTDTENLFMLPTIALDESNPNSLNNLRLYQTTLAANNPNAVKKLFKQIEDKFDYCIFDTSPAFNPFEENVFKACDEVIVVMLLDVFSTDGLAIFSKNLADFKDRKECENPKFNKIILNAFNESISFHKAIVEKMASQETFDCFLVPTDQAFKRSQSLIKPVQALTKQEGQAKKATLEALETLAAKIGE